MTSLNLKDNEGTVCGHGCCSKGDSSTLDPRADEPTGVQSRSDLEEMNIKEERSSICCASSEREQIKNTRVLAAAGVKNCAAELDCKPTLAQALTTSGDVESSQSIAAALAKDRFVEKGGTHDRRATRTMRVETQGSKVVHRRDGCCSGPRERGTGAYDSDSCIGDESKQRRELDAVSTYCSSIKSPIVPAENCCDGKPKPCCTDKCIDRLIIRESATECINCDSHAVKRESCLSAIPDGTTGCCPKSTSLRQFYRQLLRNLGCLCARIKAAGGATCCDITPQSSPDPLEIDRVASAPERGHRRCQLGRTNESQYCGSAALKDKNANGNEDQCTRPPDAVSPCCKEQSKLTTQGNSGFTTSHLEGGLAESKHVILSVSGMTCVGCETKLHRTLNAIEAVQNLKTSLVLCRAEFDLDCRLRTVDNIIKQLKRATEFEIEEIEQGCFEIEVLVPDVDTFIQQALPTGVLSLKAISKKIVRISYDPTVVGARDLVEQRFGSSLAIAPAKPDPSLIASDRHVRHVGLMTLVSAALTVPVLVFAWAPIDDSGTIVYSAVSLALATLVQFVIAGPFYPTALKSLVFARMIEMDLLIVVSTSAAYIYSVIAFGYMATGNPLATGEFFETSTLLVTLIMVGRWFSALARQQAVKSVSLRSMQTSWATLARNDDEIGREIDTRLLQYGDSFRVAPESRIATDGVVTAGVSEVDESMITGESFPVTKRVGNAVLAGSVNGSGVLTIRLSRLRGDNTISAIAKMVDEAKLSKPRIQDVADKVAKYFVPTAIVFAVLVFIIWIIVGIRVRHYDGSRAVTEALTYAITVIIVSCPCAIGLAVPMVIVIAGGIAAKHGCVFKTATTIEIARKTSHVVFDKTGTLTQGQLMVAAETYLGDQSIDVAAIHALVLDVRHPVSVAIKRQLESRIVDKQIARDVISHPGEGVEGTVHGRLVRVGNSRWLGLNGHPLVQNHLTQGFTTLCVTIDSQFVAVFGLRDSLRPDARQTIEELQKRGITVSMVSGDDQGPVSVVAQQLGITSVRSSCTPADKFRFVKNLTDAGHITIFCGDGTNDAVALTQATIGVHMNGGTDVAQCAADVVLVRSSLIDILTLIDLSKASMWRIGCNFGWSILYNTVAILFASGVLVNVRIPPEFAGLGELISVLPVIAIAVQLRWAHFSKFQRLSECRDYGSA